MELVKCIKHKRGFTVGGNYKVIAPIFKISKKTDSLMEVGVKVLDNDGLYADLPTGYFKRIDYLELIK